MGHIGFTPQFKKKFKVEGQNKKELEKLINEALKIERAGAFSVVLECISPFAAKSITKNLRYQQLVSGHLYIVMDKYW